MNPSPFLGVILHGIGGFAAGSFYAPLNKVRRWAWESYWLVMGLAAWLAAPWIVGFLTTEDLPGVLRESPAEALGYAALFGGLWGLGNLTFGLSVRYLGMALGYAVALGFCMVVGVLLPPIHEGRFHEILASDSGRVVLLGVTLCLVGIGLCGWAGMGKERELSDAEKRASVKEFSLVKGFGVAVFAGVMSACFAFGLAAGKPIAEQSVAHGSETIYSNNAVLVVVLAGGFLTNAVWCIFLIARNRSFRDFTSGPAAGQARNYALSLMGGVIWYGQFFFYGMGTTKLGEDYDFSSWSIHMAFIIVFSNLWGFYFREWKGTSGGTRARVWAGIATLIASTLVIGYGNYLAK